MKRIILILTVALLAVTSCVAVSASQYSVGDINRDGKIKIDDVTDLQKYLASITDFDDEQLLLADVDGDGHATIMDATLIQYKISGIVQENTVAPTTKDSVDLPFIPAE